MSEPWPVDALLRALRDVHQPAVVPDTREYTLSRPGDWSIRLQFDRVLDLPAPEQRRQYLLALEKLLTEESDATGAE